MKYDDVLVSVVIPTVDTRKKLLARAIDSVVGQSYNKLELIVVDEGLSATVQRNIGIGMCHGKYVAMLDDDDVWYKTKVIKQLCFMEENPSCPLVLCWSNDLRIGMGRINKPKKSVGYRQLLKGFQLSSTSSYFIRKNVLDSIKKHYGYVFDESLPTGHEYDLALRICKHFGDIYCLQEILITQYKSDSQISSDWGKKIRGQYAFMSKWGSEYRLLDYLKRIGLIGLFFGGFFLGNNIMYPINMMKQRFEERKL